ncbi:zinc ribbon domain-containing protein [Mariniluteicoccus flavus]
MKADPAAQQALLQLVESDTRASQLRHQQKSLPEHAKIAELMAERAQLVEDYTQAETEVSDLQRELRKAESDLDPVRARRVRDQERVDSGAVGDPKALRSMLEEIEHLGRRISDLEDAELELMEAADIAEKRFTMIAERRTVLEDEIRGLMKQRDAQVGELDGKIAEIGAERAAVVGGLPDALVARYDKVATLRGTGAAALVQRRCSGCRLDIDAAELRQIQAAAPDEVVTCDECGRILVREG